MSISFRHVVVSGLAVVALVSWAGKCPFARTVSGFGNGSAGAGARGPRLVVERFSGRWVARHLYVGRSAEVDRYPFINEIVQTQPDAHYPATFPIAVGPGGNLFASTTSGSGPQAQVGEYSTSSGALVRTLTVTPQKGAWLFVRLMAMAVDRHGYLFVAYDATRQGAEQHGILAYKPFAHGSDPPTASLLVGRSEIIEGLTTDASDNLYVSATNRDEVEVFSMPTSQPVILRKIRGPAMVSPRGLVIDGTGELYAGCGDPNSGPYVLAYPQTASGDPKPDRKVLVPISVDSGTQSVAVIGSHLFAALFQVDELNKLVGGPQKPEAVINVGDASSIAVGP